MSRSARLLLDYKNRVFDDILREWKLGMDAIWLDPAETANVLAELGTEAAIIFALSAKVVQELEAISPGCCQSHLALLKPFTVHANGTVTLD